MVAVEAVAAVVVAVVAAAAVAAAAVAAFSGFSGQNFEMWPIFLQDQHLGLRPSTITIISRSPLIRISGMALKPSLVRHSRKA